MTVRHLRLSLFSSLSSVEGREHHQAKQKWGMPFTCYDKKFGHNRAARSSGSCNYFFGLWNIICFAYCFKPRGLLVVVHPRTCKERKISRAPSLLLSLSGGTCRTGKNHKDVEGAITISRDNRCFKSLGNNWHKGSSESVLSTSSLRGCCYALS